MTPRLAWLQGAKGVFVDEGVVSRRARSDSMVRAPKSALAVVVAPDLYRCREAVGVGTRHEVVPYEREEVCLHEARVDR